MATLVKIKRDSIKRNPNAFSTQTMIHQGSTASFRIEGKPPVFLKEGKNFFMTKREFGDGAEVIEGILTDPELLDKLSKVSGASVSVENHIQTCRHMPEAEYLYKYEDTKIKCTNCGKHVLTSKILAGFAPTSDGDEYNVDICPNCKAVESFPREYEDIYEVVKAEHLGV